MLNVIINADDYGLTQRCTEAIYEAWERKLITDTTMVANGECFENAVQKAKATELIDNIGIHFNLTEKVPLTERIKKMDSFVQNGEFHGRINRKKRLSEEEKLAIYEELQAQVERIKGAGINLTHADSHHHIHTIPFITPIVIRVCREYCISKIRIHRNIGDMSIVKRIGKKILNEWLSSQGMITTKYFGSLEDVINGEIKKDLEIMVHPDFDFKGHLIDRKKKNGQNYAEGSLLSLPENIGEYELICYKELI